MKIHWGRILIAGIVAEGLLAAVYLFSAQYSILVYRITVSLGGFVLMFFAALWVARTIESRFILHGTLVGLAAIVFYVILTFYATLQGQVPINVEYFLAHTIKILGGAAGGFVGGRRRTNAV